MLIEKIIEFEFSKLGPLVVHVLLQLVKYSYGKIKSLKANFRVDYDLLLKYCWRECILLPLSGPNHLHNLTLKCNILNTFRT